MRIRHTTPLIGLLCLVLAGCTTTSQGEPTPETTSAITDSPSSSTDENDDLPTNGAPKVGDPLDTTRFQQEPCATLTKAQAADLNLPATGEPTDIVGGVGCEWDNRDTRGYALVGFVTSNSKGLSNVYASNERGEYSYFNPLPDINGYPGVVAHIEDSRSRGICGVFVGVTDELVVDIAVKLSAANVGNADPCEVVVDVAGMALQTMKEGA